jgi:hypothetical protein
MVAWLTDRIFEQTKGQPGLLPQLTGQKLPRTLILALPRRVAINPAFNRAGSH